MARPHQEYYEMRECLEGKNALLLAQPDGQLTVLYKFLELMDGKKVDPAMVVPLSPFAGNVVSHLMFTHLGVPTTSMRAFAVLDSVAGDDVQLVKVTLDVPIAGFDHGLLNILHHVDCLDHSASKVWISTLATTVLLADRIGSPKIFRIKSHPGTIIVSSEVKSALEGAGCSDRMEFVPVESH